MKHIKLLVAATALMMMAASCGKEEPAPVQVSDVTLNKKTLALTVGDSETLTATVTPADATDKTVTWTSSASGVASVDASTGEVTAVAKGEATITATTANGKKAMCEVTVTEAVVEVEDVALEPAMFALAVGRSAQFGAIITPDNATNKTVTWTSSNTDVARVNASTGEVTAIAEGTASITATTANGKKATCEITVTRYIVETVLIPAGTFLMGSSNGSVSNGIPGVDPNVTPAEPDRDDNERQHSVALTKDYYMSKYEITNALYAAFLNDVEIDATGAKAGIQEGKTLIEASDDEYDWGLHYSNGRWEPVAGYENHPVLFVSWYGAKAFAEWAGGDLPTEAQWERAARGGVENMPFGIEGGKVLTGNMANFYGPYPYDFDNGGAYDDTNGIFVESTTAVGSYSANTYGLYDMHGNVWEWCLDQWDGYSDNYADLPATDPVGETGPDRVLRGGYWGISAWLCRSAFRYNFSPGDCVNDIGFRVVFFP